MNEKSKENAIQHTWDTSDLRRVGLIEGEHEIRDGVVVRCGNQEVGAVPADLEREECLMHRPSCERCPVCKQWIPRLAIGSMAAAPSSQEHDQ